MTSVSSAADFSLGDEQLRATGMIKWVLPEPGVIPAWVAEMDVAGCPSIRAALTAAVQRGVFGYPSPQMHQGVREATAAFVAERLHLDVPADQIEVVGDVMTAIRVALHSVCAAAPVVVPVPTYGPFLDVVPVTGRELIAVPCVDRGSGITFDLEAIDAALEAGARTVLIANPGNPSGRSWSVEELGALRDLVASHRARVISDEVHAPLVLPGGRHTAYAGLPGAAEHTTTIVAASKSFNTPGLKCAQLIAGTPADALALSAGVRRYADHDFSTLGAIATVAAYQDGGAWLDSLIVHLDERRTQFAHLLAAHLPALRWQPMEATYLAWLDAGPTGLDDPAAAAKLKGSVMLSAGRTFGGAQYSRFVRVNLATSPERLNRIVKAMAQAWF